MATSLTLSMRRRQLKEIQLAKARGEVMQSSEILAVMQTVMGAVRARLLSLPNRLPTMIHGMTKDHIQIVKREVYDILNRLVADGSVVLKDLQDKAIDESTESAPARKAPGRGHPEVLSGIRNPKGNHHGSIGRHL